jgi:fibronectin-binding autotransporter adhesin
MIKSAFLRSCLVLFILLVFSLPTRAQVNWTGAVSTDWANGANWSSGTVPGATDNVQIGVVAFTAQPALSNSTQIRNLTFGGPVPVILTIPAGSTLQVSGKIVQNHAADNLTASTLITGSGTLSCAAVMVGDLISPRFVQSKTTTFVSKINVFTISGNIDLNSVTANLLTGGVANSNSLFSLQGGQVSLGGKINTGNLLPVNCNSFGDNSPNARFSIDINSGQDAWLKLADNSAVNFSNPVYAAADFYNYLSGAGRGTVEYGGGDQLVYTNTTPGIDTSPVTYQDLVISGTGTKTVGSAAGSNQLLIGGNLVVKSATLDLAANSPDTVVAGDLTTSGTVKAGTGTTTIKGALIFSTGASGTISVGAGELHFPAPPTP